MTINLAAELSTNWLLTYSSWLDSYLQADFKPSWMLYWMNFNLTELFIFILAEL